MAKNKVSSLSCEEIRKQFDSLSHARDIAERKNSPLRNTIKILDILRESSVRLSLYQIKFRAVSEPTNIRTTLERLANGGVLEMEDEGQFTGDLSRISGKQYWLSEGGKELAGYIAERFPKLPGYDEVYAGPT